MVNSIRGEISAQLDGKSWTLCLTLGALASLETSLGAENILELSDKFSSGKLQSKDLITIITAGLVGGGHDVTEQDVSMMKIDGGVAGYVELVARLLDVTFSPLKEDTA